MAKQPSKPPEVIKQALEDADRLGDAESAQLHGITDRTLRRWRRAYGVGRKPRNIKGGQQKVKARAEMIALISQAQLDAKVRRTRSTLLDAIDRLARFANKPDDLHRVAGAYKLVTDGDIADRLVPPAQAGAPAPTPNPPTTPPASDDHGGQPVPDPGVEIPGGATASGGGGSAADVIRH